MWCVPGRGCVVAHDMRVTAVFPVRRMLSWFAPSVLLGACAGAPPPAPLVRPVAGPTISLLVNWHAKVLVDIHDSIVLSLPSGDHQVQQFEQNAVFTLDVANDGAVSIRLDSLTRHPSPDEVARVTSFQAAWTARANDIGVNAFRVLAGGEFAEGLTAFVRRLLPRPSADQSPS